MFCYTVYAAARRRRVETDAAAATMPLKPWFGNGPVKRTEKVGWTAE